MKTLWKKENEHDFFIKSLNFAAPEQLFYTTSAKKFYAYWPKSYGDAKTTLQSRNSLIGTYTEKWSTELFSEIAEQLGGYSVQGAICEEIGLTNQSPADVAICKTKDLIQKPENILMIGEVKMSIVWNWEYKQVDGKAEIVCIGDYKTHTGQPSIRRSDSMLKAIGKSINVRVSSDKAAKIPIIVIGNTPINPGYYKKVDHLKQNGIIQGFWSVNPYPLDNSGENIKRTPVHGFYRFDSYDELKEKSLELLKEEREFFSSMQSKKKLGEIIEIANNEQTYERKAEKFLQLIKYSES
ncbi:MAG: hypothetical protein Q7S61_01100 [bacterium]|nr:hypothetical protein [bacterium]